MEKDSPVVAVQNAGPQESSRGRRRKSLRLQLKQISEDDVKPVTDTADYVAKSISASVGDEEGHPTQEDTESPQKLQEAEERDSANAPDKLNGDIDDPRTSLEAFMKSKDYQAFLRTHEDMKGVQQRLSVYQDYRKYFPKLFRDLLQDPYMQEWVPEKPSLLTLLGDYAVLFVGICVLVYYSFVVANGRILWPILPWILGHVGAWCYKTSFFSIGRNCFWVKGEYENEATIWMVLLAQFVEMLFILLTGGVGLIVSFVLKIYRSKGQSVGEFLVGVHMVREIQKPVEYA